MTYAMDIVAAFLDGVPPSEFLLPFICSACCGGIFFGNLAWMLIATVFLLRDMLADAYRHRFPPKDAP